MKSTVVKITELLELIEQMIDIKIRLHEDSSIEDAMNLINIKNDIQDSLEKLIPNG